MKIKIAGAAELETALAKVAALYDYVFRGGPAPDADWKPSVPEPSEKEKDALRLHWDAVRRAEDFEA